MEGYKKIGWEEFAEYLLTKIQIVGVQAPTEEQSKASLVPIVVEFFEAGSLLPPVREVYLLQAGSPDKAAQAYQYIKDRLAQEAEGTEELRLIRERRKREAAGGRGEAGEPSEAV